MIKLIKNGNVITMDESRKERIEKLDIVILDDKIKLLTDNYDGEYDELIDASNKIVMPGLINAHTHIGMSIFRASNDSLTLMDWLNTKIWPIEDKFKDEDVYYTSLLSCYEMIKSGTTTFNDMYMNCEGVIKAIKESGLRTLFSRSLCDNDGGGERRLNEFYDLYNKYNDNDLIRFSMTPHAMYTCSSDYLKECSDIASKFNIPFHMHFCENESEIKGIKEQYNCLPVEAIKKLGLFRNKLILAHGTFISEEEIKMLKECDASIVTNPISNLNLGCGIANITSYSKYVNVCLGTDGQGSGNNMNMFYHMSILDLLQKGLYKDPTIMSSYDVLKMATVNGAKALGINDIGMIKEGNKADVIMLDMNDIMTYPSTQIFNNIVHNAWFNSIDTTIVNGNVLMKDKKMLIDFNIEEIKNRIDSIIERVTIEK